jgi:hypothetical protein
MPPKKQGQDIDSILKILEESSIAAELMLKCQKAKCKAAHAAGEQQKKRMRQHGFLLVQQLKDRKITPKAFVEAMKDEVERIKESKESLAIMECAVRMCQAEARRMLRSIGGIHEYACKSKKDDKACAAHARVSNIVGKKAPVTVEEYMFSNAPGAGPSIFK